MDNEKFISRGLLESYVLGNCSDEERREVESRLHEPEIQKEILAIENSLEEYAMLHSKTPPQDLKYKIQTAIEVSEMESKMNEKIIALQTSFNEKKKNPRMNFYKLAVAASVVLFLGSSFINFLLYNKIIERDNQLASLQNEKSVLAANTVSMHDSISKISNDAFLLRHPMKIVAMNGLQISPQSKAMVYWDSKNNLTFLEINNLPKPASEMEYQLWAIVDGKPVDAGVFMPDDFNHLHPMKNIGGNVSAFAVTLEKMGGVSSPTMERMYVMGKV